MTLYKIVKASNYDLDYYEEKFVENLPSLDEASANHIAVAINRAIPKDGPVYYKVVEAGYVLRTADPNEW